MNIPSAWGKESEQIAKELPRSGHIEMGESVVVLQTQNENARKESAHEGEKRVGEIPAEGDEGNALARNRRNCDGVPPYVKTQQSGSSAPRKPEKRYPLRQVPKRLVLRAGRR